MVKFGGGLEKIGGGIEVIGKIVVVIQLAGMVKVALEVGGSIAIFIYPILYVGGKIELVM